MNDSPTAVYRYYDRHGVLIYVGITKQGAGRNFQHSAKAPWWPFVASQEVDHLPDRCSALTLERELIQLHRPPFNKQHNPDHAEMRQAYEAFAAVDVEPIDAYSALNRQVSLRLVDAHSDGTAIWATEPPVFRLARELELKDPVRVVESNHNVCGRVIDREVVGMSVHFRSQIARRVLVDRGVERVVGKLAVKNIRGGYRFLLRAVSVPDAEGVA